MLSRRALLRGLGIAGVAPSAGCAWGLRGFPFDEGLSAPAPPLPPSTLELRYIGVGCFHLRMGEVAVLSDPYWSHLSLPRAALGRLAPRRRQIEPHLPDLSTVHGVLVGHGHYDHVLDLPYVAPLLHPEAKVLGSRSLRHQLAPELLEREVLDVEPSVATADSEGQWLTLAGGRLRVLPILSGHPPQWWHIHLYRGGWEADRKRPARRAWHFQEGTTLAWLIDFIDPAAPQPVQARVFLQTSSTGFPAGYFPEALLEERGVDLALLPMDSANYAEQRGSSILDLLQPPEVVLCHWESFFRPKTRPPKETVKVDLWRTRAFFDASAGPRVRIPSWDATYRYPVEG